MTTERDTPRRTPCAECGGQGSGHVEAEYVDRIGWRGGRSWECDECDGKGYTVPEDDDDEEDET